MLPASFVFWWVGAQSSCGGEVYDTPPGSLGDTLCGSLVEPIVPWAAIASAPLLIAAVGGFIALRRQRWCWFVFSIAVPALIVVGGLFLILAVF
jgi:hypothetical protein